MGAIRALYWEAKMQLTAEFRYKFGVVSEMVVFAAMLAFFLVSDTGTSFSEKYAFGNSKTLFLLGYVAWILAVSAIAAISEAVTEELQRGTFYKKMHSKYPLQFLLFGRLIASVMIQTVIAAVLVAVARWVFHVDIPFRLFIAAVIFVGTLGMYGIGLAIAGLSVYFKHTGSIVFLVQLGLLFITDTIPSPGAILSVTRVLPLTLCNDVIRNYVSTGVIDRSFLILCLSATAFLFAGTVIFSVTVRSAKKKGNLLFY